MATNKFFRHQVKSEQNLAEDLTIEAIRMYGHDVIYIPRTLVNKDFLFGEDTISKFEQGLNIEMYISSIDGFEGEGDFASKFGIQIKDTIEFIVSKKVFEKNLSHETNINRPNEGDLIYLPLSNSLFEIKFVEHENPFYQMGKLYTFKLSCELFEYSQEDFDTGFSDIDKVEGVAEDVAFNIYLTGGATTNYSVGEVVYQGTAFGTQGSSADWYATVLDWATGGTAGPSGAGYNLLTVAGPSGASGFIIGVGNTAGVTGSTSGAFYKAGTTASPSIRTLTIAQDFDDADDFELEADSIFDFTDKDPFSEGNL
tara:strand:- start:1277 stop:2212 length:936 start_codon:yes stop_codon:yes gene_type:complete